MIRIARTRINCARSRKYAVHTLTTYTIQSLVRFTGVLVQDSGSHDHDDVKLSLTCAVVTGQRHTESQDEGFGYAVVDLLAMSRAEAEEHEVFQSASKKSLLWPAFGCARDSVPHPPCPPNQPMSSNRDTVTSVQLNLADRKGSSVMALLSLADAHYCHLGSDSESDGKCIISRDMCLARVTTLTFQVS